VNKLSCKRKDFIYAYYNRSREEEDVESASEYQESCKSPEHVAFS